MNERKTSSMLQRVPVILAVTAASYGLQLPAQIVATSQAEAGMMTAGAHTEAQARGAGVSGTSQRAA